LTEKIGLPAGASRLGRQEAKTAELAYQFALAALQAELQAIARDAVLFDMAPKE
jgi:hypothetical protein